MRLPQSILQPCSVFALNFLAIAAALVLVGFIPQSAAAAASQLTCSSTNLQFGSVGVNQSESLLVTLTNTGNTSVSLTGMASSNIAFATTSLGLPMTLTAGQSVDFDVSFTPATTGWAGGNIKFYSDASNPTLTISVGGTGVSSEPLSLTPATLSFGSVATGSRSTLPVTLTNKRSWNVKVSAAQSSSSEFSVTGVAFPLILKQGQSVTLNVTFTPQSAGEIGGSVLVSGPDVNLPVIGTGTTGSGQYSVSLYWNSSEGIQGYNVYRSTSANGTYSKINSALDGNSSYTDSTVSPGKTYYYEATAVNTSGQESARSTPAVEATVP